MAISGSGGSKWLDLSGSWLDLGGIHPGWSVGAIWTHRNCPGGLQGGQKWPKNAIKRAFMAISGSGVSKWLDFSGSWLDLGGIHPGWSVAPLLSSMIMGYVFQFRWSSVLPDLAWLCLIAASAIGLLLSFCCWPRGLLLIPVTLLCILIGQLFFISIG